PAIAFMTPRTVVWWLEGSLLRMDPALGKGAEVPALNGFYGASRARGSHRFDQPLFYFSGGQRATHQEALHHIAVGLLEKLALRCGFRALCNNGQFQVVAQGDDA